MWNPIHYAIYFRQYEALDYFFDDLNVNSRLALALHEASNEVTFAKNGFIEKKP
jgi:hypothetical protein